MTQKASFAMLTDPGRVRRVNQDACAADPELGAFVVCDGMGGAAGGEVASQMVTTAFLDAMAQQDKRFRRQGQYHGVVAADRIAVALRGALPLQWLAEAKA